MDFTSLKTWAQSHTIAERTIQRFWDFFHTYQQEQRAVLQRYYDDFSETLLIIEVDRIALEIETPLDAGKYLISAHIRLIYQQTYYKKRGKKVPYRDGKKYNAELGHYKLYFTPNGEIAKEEFELN